MDGKCCICGFECNFSSQTCGSCARELTGYSLGWNQSQKITDYLAEMESDNIITKNISDNNDTKKKIKK